MSAEDLKAQGNKALQAGNYDEAIDCYTRAIELDQSNHVFFSNRSAAYLMKHDASSALRDAEKCVSLNPSWAKGYSRKGAALHSLKRYDDAIAAYQEGLKVAPGDQALLSGLQEVQHAKEAASPPPGQNPFGNLFGPNILSTIATNPRLSKYLAEPDFVQKIQLLQSNPNMLTNFINDPRIMEVFSVLLGFNASSAEETSADESHESHPHHHEPPHKAEEPSKQQEKNQEPNQKEVDDSQLTEEEKEINQKKKRASDIKQRANDLYKSKQFDEALRLYDEAIELDPTEMTYHLNKAAVYFETKDYDLSIEHCHKAVEVGRANRAPYANIAKAFIREAKVWVKKNEYNLAIQAYQNAQMEDYSKEIERTIKQLELEKRNFEAQAYIDPEKAKEAKERGNELFRAGNYAEALKEYEEAVKRDPNAAVYRHNLATALAKVGDFIGAKNNCEKALELDKNYVKAWAKKGDIEFFMKEYHKAMESYKKGLAVEPGNTLCTQGLNKTIEQINMSARTGEVDNERAAHALADPEIQSILNDPVIRQVLKDLQENPREGQKALRDPVVANKIEKLIAAGILQAR
jgi:stress-induced-phosphoprotein 1